MGNVHPAAPIAGETLLAHPAPLAHGAQLYTEEHELGAAVADFVATGLREGASAVVIGSIPRWNALLKNLGALDVDSRAAVQCGRLRGDGDEHVAGDGVETGEISLGHSGVVLVPVGAVRAAGSWTPRSRSSASSSAAS